MAAPPVLAMTMVRLTDVEVESLPGCLLTPLKVSVRSENVTTCPVALPAVAVAVTGCTMVGAIPGEDSAATVPDCGVGGVGIVPVVGLPPGAPEPPQAASTIQRNNESASARHVNIFKSLSPSSLPEVSAEIDLLLSFTIRNARNAAEFTDTANGYHLKRRSSSLKEMSAFVLRGEYALQATARRRERGQVCWQLENPARSRGRSRFWRRRSLPRCRS